MAKMKTDMSKPKQMGSHPNQGYLGKHAKPANMAQGHVKYPMNEDENIQQALKKKASAMPSPT